LLRCLEVSRAHDREGVAQGQAVACDVARLAERGPRDACALLRVNYCRSTLSGEAIRNRVRRLDGFQS
jgi:hypothetical protein